MRDVRFLIFMFAIAIGFTFQPGSAWGSHFTKFKPYIPAIGDVREPVKQRRFGCYDFITYEKIDCKWEMVLRVMKPEEWNPPLLGDPGGHEHGERPLSAIGGLRLKGSGDGWALDIPVFNQFDQGTDIAEVEYLVPEVSGSFAWQFTITTPDGYVHTYPSRCLGQKICTEQTLVSIMFPRYELPSYPSLGMGPDDFAPLPETWGFYRVGLDPDSTSYQRHPRSTFAKPNTIQQIQEIAKEYYKQSAFKHYLSVNDLSLPRGGMFDLNGNWNVANTPGNGHVDHRTGTDVDINRKPLTSLEPIAHGAIINCEDDKFLKKAVQIIREKYGIKFPKRKCESGGRKHINFD